MFEGADEVAGGVDAFELRRRQRDGGGVDDGGEDVGIQPGVGAAFGAEALVDVLARVVGDVAHDGFVGIATQGGVFAQDAGGVADGTDERHVVAAGAPNADEVSAQAGLCTRQVLQDGGEVFGIVAVARGQVGVFRVEAGTAVDAVVIRDEGAFAAVHARRHTVAVVGAALSAQGTDGVAQCGCRVEGLLPAAAVDDSGVVVKRGEVGDGGVFAVDVGMVGKGSEQGGQNLTDRKSVV